jgi:hypothetical protein
MIVVDAAGATEAVTGQVRERCCRATLDQEGVLRRVAGDLADVVDARTLGGCGGDRHGEVVQRHEGVRLYHAG